MFGSYYVEWKYQLFNTHQLQYWHVAVVASLRGVCFSWRPLSQVKRSRLTLKLRNIWLNVVI